MTIQHYVCCIALCPERAEKDMRFNVERVPAILLLKNKGPDSLIGKLNGIGGRYELPESPIGAMQREWKEETGVDIEDKDRFRHFYQHRAISKSYMAGSQYQIHWYALELASQEFLACQTQPGEEALVAADFPVDHRGLNPFSMASSGHYPLAMDMHYLLPMAYQTLAGYLEQNLD